MMHRLRDGGVSTRTYNVHNLTSPATIFAIREASANVVWVVVANNRPPARRAVESDQWPGVSGDPVGYRLRNQLQGLTIGYGLRECIRIHIPR